MIPEAAEAAISALYGDMPGPAYTFARAALEAAAPHMLAEAAANERVRELALRLLNEDFADALEVLDQIALGKLELFGDSK